jgi:hypothetical protein
MYNLTFIKELALYTIHITSVTEMSLLRWHKSSELEMPLIILERIYPVAKSPPLWKVCIVLSLGTDVIALVLKFEDLVKSPRTGNI